MLRALYQKNGNKNRLNSSPKGTILPSPIILNSKKDLFTVLYSSKIDFRVCWGFCARFKEKKERMRATLANTH